MPKHKSHKRGKITTELGLQIETTKSHADAERLASLKEQIEDRSESLKNGLEKLVDQMREDGIETCTVKAPGGSLYKFEVAGSETKVRIKHATLVETVMAERIENPVAA